MAHQIIRNGIFLLLSFTSLCYSQTYVINLSEVIAQTYKKEDIEAFFNHMYQQTGIQPKYVYYPSQRGLNLVNQGKLDADAARFREVGANYSNLVMVEEPLGAIEFILVCLRSTDCLTEQRNVGVITGFFIGSTICEAMYLDCHVAQDLDTLSKLLTSGRIDSVLIASVSSPNLICSLEEKQIYYTSLDQFAQPVFHFVHKSHSDIVVALDRQIPITRTSDIGRKILNTWLERLTQCGKIVQQIYIQQPLLL